MNTSKDELMRSISRRRDAGRSPVTTTNCNDCDTVDAYLARGGRIHVAKIGESGATPFTYNRLVSKKAPEFDDRVPKDKLMTIEQFKSASRLTHYSPETLGFLRRCFVGGISFEDAAGTDPIHRAKQKCREFWRSVSAVKARRDWNKNDI